MNGNHRLMLHLLVYCQKRLIYPKDYHIEGKTDIFKCLKYENYDKHQIECYSGSDSTFAKKKCTLLLGKENKMSP